MTDFDSKQLEKIEAYREDGIEPYSHGESIRFNFVQFRDTYQMAEYVSIVELEHLKTRFAGRILFKNEMGNVGFARAKYNDITLQIFISKKEVGADVYKQIWKKLDIGDSIMVEGVYMRTRTGELTLRANNISIVSKCIKGMPDKSTGITDPEVMQRQRYLDLMVNPDSFVRFNLRSKIISRVRWNLEKRRFVEVETPVLQSIPGGASAKPFVTHHNALNSELYMRIAPELFLKRLIVGGMPRVFEIGKNFRNEGISTKHNPEFTMVEFYSSYTDYNQLMEMTREIIVDVVEHIYDEHVLPFENHSIDFLNWTEVTFMDSLRNVGVEDPWNTESLKSFIYSSTELEDLSDDLTELWDIAFDRFVEPTLINPTFITQYPVEISPLARRNDEDSRVTDRFELFIGSFEVANAFNELNDPVEQAERFKVQAERKAGGDDEAMYFDSDFITALSYGMPPTAGEGIGLDRLVMLLTNSSSIRDIILFPTKK